MLSSTNGKRFVILLGQCVSVFGRLICCYLYGLVKLPSVGPPCDNYVESAEPGVCMMCKHVRSDHRGSSTRFLNLYSFSGMKRELEGTEQTEPSPASKAAKITSMSAGYASFFMIPLFYCLVILSILVF